MLVVTDQSKFMAQNQRHHPLKCMESIDPSGQENFYHPSHLPTALVGTVEICAMLMHGVQHMRCDWKLIAFLFGDVFHWNAQLYVFASRFLVGDMDETKSALMKNPKFWDSAECAVSEMSQGVRTLLSCLARKGWWFQKIHMDSLLQGFLA